MVKTPETEVIVDYTGKLAGGPPPVVFFPFIFQDVIRIADTLRDRLDVIVNLTHVQKAEKLRVLDFLCGFSYALGIKKRRLDDGVYLFTYETVPAAASHPGA